MSTLTKIAPPIFKQYVAEPPLLPKPSDLPLRTVPERRARLFVMMGLPGCGKSTWAKRFFERYLIVSTDAIRAELYDGDYDPERNDEVFDLFHKRIGMLLADGKDAIADSTALTYEKRYKLANLAGAFNAEIHLVVFTNTLQAQVNNQKRDERWVVPDDVMKSFMSKFHAAILDIKDEKYDSMTYIEGVEEWDPRHALYRRERS